MKKILRIGIVGCGAIGTSLAKIIARDFRSKAKCVKVYDRDAKRAKAVAQTVIRGRRIVARDLDAVISGCDLIIECASAQCSFEIAKAVLAKGKDVVVMSVGGVVGRFAALKKAAAAKGGRIYIPSGAICGIDALKAARFSSIRSVTLTTRKPPLSFKSVPYIAAKKIDLAAIRKDTVLFSGSAVQAMKYFPQNINVAGILSLAGIGPSRTRVCIIASPAATRNSHEISIEADAGTITTKTENVIHPDNPKTSYLAVLSAAGLIGQIIDPVRIGT